MQKGFSLVELAIVLVIIGLLTGGILKGRELLMNTRTATTISALQDVRVAAETFKKTYGDLPGDIVNPGQVIPACVNNCTTPGNGDGNIGWDVPATYLPGSIGIENTTFWLHLAAANLVRGISVHPDALEFGLSHPMTPLSGLFVFHQPANGGLFTDALQTPNPAGNMLILLDSFGAVNAIKDMINIPAPYVQRIDQKLDDGKPNTGQVRAIGLRSGVPEESCVSDATDAGEYVLESNICSAMLPLRL
ncbi:MAG: type II secretion system protein [Pseudomonadota bacterium]